jgi:hypothetical protein
MDEAKDGVTPEDPNMGPTGGFIPPYITERIRRDKILSRTCPACLAPVGEPCTAPTDTGRREIKGFHLARESDEEASTNGETTEKGLK